MVRWGYIFKKFITGGPVLLYEKRARRLREQHPPAAPSSPPEEHRIHPHNGAEWWYFSGVLATPSRRQPLGFEAVFFRVRWGPESRFLHTAVSDVESGSFTERGSAWGPYVPRQPQLPVLVAVGCNALLLENGHNEILLRTHARQLSLNLHMKPGAVMLQGDEGMTAMQHSSVSCYYSMPHMPTTGTIRLHGTDFSVTGATWFDHQWGDFSVCHPAWDWFSVRLDNGLSAMLFLFRDPPGIRGTGSIHGPSGTRRLSSVSVKALRLFRTRDGVVYPLDWNVSLRGPDHVAATLRITPVFDDQYVTSWSLPSYWEGLCVVEGTVVEGGVVEGVPLHKGQPLRGTAYVELTGYERLQGIDRQDPLLRFS